MVTTLHTQLYFVICSRFVLLILFMKDIDIRQELHSNYLSHFAYDSNARIIDELGLCQGSFKIDVAVINGSLVGYEIKSEQDTLYRLDAQMNAYNKVFDYINIIVNDKHLKAIEDKVPIYWGIISVKKFGGDLKLITERKAERNTNTNAFELCQLLWKEEALDLLRIEKLDKGMKSKSRKEIWEKISTCLSKDKINEYVRIYIKKRTWRQFD